MLKAGTYRRIVLCSGGVSAIAAADLALASGAWLAAIFAPLSALFCSFAVVRSVRAERAAAIELDSSREEARALRESARAEREAAQALGVELGDSVARTVSILHRLEGLASGAADGIVVLNQSLVHTVEAQEATLGAHVRVKESLGSYSREVAVESAAVESMVGAVGRLASSSKEKGESMRGLLERADGAESQLLSIKKAADRMIQTAKKTEDMNARISDLSERTNLLAINASIEAAHAGAAGRGFVIVAGQVKALSEESRKNSQAISAAIAETLGSIGDTSTAAEGAIDYFRKVVAEIRELVGTFQNFLSEIQALSEGSSKLLGSLESIAGLNSDSGRALRSSEESMEKSKDSLGIVRDIASTIQSDAAAMMIAFKENLAEAARAKELGERAMLGIGEGVPSRKP
jgi:methyl-accepting chemotaxis protein